MSRELGITVKKHENFSEWFSQVVFKANLADIRYGIQGFIVHREWGTRILRKIYELLEEEVEKDGHDPVLFPIAIPEKFFEKEKEHAEGFSPEVFWVTRAGDNELNEPFALRPTSETAFYSMYSLWIRSYRDLPFKKYQSRICVYRYESHTRPFLRGREFLFFETHCAFKNEEEAMEQVKRDMEIMKRVAWEKLFIPFLFLKRPYWDKFAGAESTFAADSVMPDGKISQIGTTHYLGTKFSRAFNVKYRDKDGKEKYCHITCFGPGIWRLMASVVAIHGDDNGLILPSSIAPYKCVIVPIYYGNEEEIDRRCVEVKKLLEENDISCIFDDRKEETPGFKFNHWELLGVPLRIEIGPRDVENNTCVLVRRADRGKRVVSVENLVEEVKREIERNDEIIKERATRYHVVRSAKTLEEVESLAKQGGFIRAPFCSIDEDGEKCAEILQERTGLKVRGVLIDKEEKPEEGDRCIVCGRKANVIVYLAKAY